MLSQRVYVGAGRTREGGKLGIDTLVEAELISLVLVACCVGRRRDEASWRLCQYNMYDDAQIERTRGRGMYLY